MDTYRQSSMQPRQSDGEVEPKGAPDKQRRLLASSRPGTASTLEGKAEDEDE